MNPQASERADRGAQPAEVRGYFVQVPLPQPGDGTDLRALWRHVVDHRLMIALFVVVPMALATAVVLLMRPVYEANVVTVPVETEGATSGLSTLANQFGGLASLVGISVPSGSTKEQTIAILTSRAFTEAFIKSENLMPVLFADKWDSGAGKWKPMSQRRIPTMADAVEMFDEEIRWVSDDPATNLVTLRIEWHDRELAAQWANTMIRRLNDDIRKRDVAEAQRSMEFISRELERNDKVELRQGMYTLMQQQLERIVMANVREDYAFKVLEPAFVAEADDYIWPKKIATIAAAGVLGLVLAILAVALRVTWQPKRRG